MKMQKCHVKVEKVVEGFSTEMYLFDVSIAWILYPYIVYYDANNLGFFHNTGWFQMTFPERHPVTRVRSWGLNALDNTTSSWQPVRCNNSWSCLALEGPQEVGEWLERSL